jgi:hypothetical protein
VLVVPLFQVVTTTASADTATLTVETTSYSAPEPAPGLPVSYTSTVDLQQDSEAVTITHTAPTGVTPLGGYGGPEWLCRTPSAQSITCTTVAETFTAATTLPTVTFSGIVTTPGMTASTIQTSSATVASAGDASVSDTLMTAGTVPAAPTGVSVTQSGGPVGGGNPVTVSAATDVTTTILLIGTAAEFEAGTPETLLPCQSDTGAGCFTTNETGGSVESMPARATPAAVDVMVVTLGVGASTTYSYNQEAGRSGPAADPTGSAPTNPSGEPPGLMPAAVFGPMVAPAGEEGVPYQISLVPPPEVFYMPNWAVSGGMLPPGLRLTSTGAL